MKKQKYVLIMFAIISISFFAFMIYGKVKASNDIPSTTVEINEEDAAKSNLEVLEVRFDPIHRGKNIVHVQVKNNSEENQTFCVHIQTHTRKAGSGSVSEKIIKADNTSWVSFPFVFHDSIEKATVRLMFYGSSWDSHSDTWQNTWFKKYSYNCSELPHRTITANELRQVSKADANNVIQVFKKFQLHISNGEFDKAWTLCTNDFLEAAKITTVNSGFVKNGSESLYWDIEILVNLQTDSTLATGTHFYLRATHKKIIWLIDFVQTDGQWEIDWIDHKYHEYKNSPPDALDSKREQESLAESKTKAVSNTVKQIIGYLVNEDYPMAWQCLSRHIQRDTYDDDFEKFKKKATATEGLNLLRFLSDQKPDSFSEEGEFQVLNARDQWGKIWKWFFIKEDGKWKLFVIKPPQRGNWKERLLPTMQRRTTEHFDIYYFKDSTAEKELEQIVKDKEEGYGKVCSVLGEDFDLRIEMIYFEDATTKYLATLHMGVGWAVGKTNVEIYNEKEKCDPYHETVHTIMGNVGSPPAMFNEGFATYMQKAPWEDQHVDKTAADLLRNGNLTPLNMLIARKSIGGQSNDGQVAYPESASFVKFLIERYGKDRFLQAYKKLRNSDDADVRKQNLETLEQVYGKSLISLEKEWKAILGDLVK